MTAPIENTSRPWLLVGVAIVVAGYVAVLVGVPPIKLTGLLEWGFEPVEIGLAILLSTPAAGVAAVYLGSAFEQLHG